MTPLLLQLPLSGEPPRAVSGSGSYITLSDGRTILDADSGAAVACIGHGNQRVANAISLQASTLAFTWSGAFGSEPAHALAQRLVATAPNVVGHVFFSSSGSEAVEAALKLARQFHVENGEPQRTHFIGRRQSFHGATFGALNIGGHRARRKPFEPLLSENFSHVSPCFAFHHKQTAESNEAYVERLAVELETEFERIGPNRVAAFCAETIAGGTLGAVSPAPGYFARVREICDRYGALLILDEVMCGMGRAGVQHAWQNQNIEPDIVTIGKALGGGYVPISATLCSARVMDAIAQGSGLIAHGHTYQAHPVACAAALEVQDIIAENDLIQRADLSGKALRKVLADRLGDKPWLGEVRGEGLMVGVEFLHAPAKRTPFDPELAVARRVRAAAFEQGISVFASTGAIDGHRGDHVFLAPPFNVTDDEIELIAERLTKGAEAAFSSL